MRPCFHSIDELEKLKEYPSPDMSFNVDYVNSDTGKYSYTISASTNNNIITFFIDNKKCWFSSVSWAFKEISKNVDIPLLRKDFIIDEIRIYEAKVIRASAILLICAILDEDTLKRYFKIADDLGMSVLVEAHDEEEIQKAIRCGARIVGVNNRNLKDFTVDINNSINLRKSVDEDIIFVSESGIKNSKDIKRLVENNVNAVLIGETLMKCSDKAAMIKDLKSEVVWPGII